MSENNVAYMSDLKALLTQLDAELAEVLCGTSGYILTGNGTSTAPTWKSAPKLTLNGTTVTLTPGVTNSFPSGTKSYTLYYSYDTPSSTTDITWYSTSVTGRYYCLGSVYLHVLKIPRMTNVKNGNTYYGIHSDGFLTVNDSTAVTAWLSPNTRVIATTGSTTYYYQTLANEDMPKAGGAVTANFLPNNSSGYTGNSVVGTSSGYPTWYVDVGYLFPGSTLFWISTNT